LRGYEVGIASDFGYTAINAAFVLDLLADDESARFAPGSLASDPCDRAPAAKKIRREIVDQLPKLVIANPWLQKEWWFHVTVAEAYFGLEEYENAEPSLKAAAALPDIPDWEYETTVRQLATLARLLMRRADKEKPMDGSPAWKALESFLGEHAAGVRSAFYGKVGLALSGGGFRASLFHIGVLAKLAEFDVLRHVEVLSCVSGGSIVGAHYYLKVRKAMAANGKLKREDYIKIVSELEREFLAGVQMNIRTRVAGSLIANLKMALLSDYSRSERAGELYEQHLYSRADQSDGGFLLNNLFITPADERDKKKPFRPKYDNWRREAKVPVLELNATTLNTGHNWQFTASWMGEPPAETGGDIDANYRLRRMYYSEAPPDYREIRLGAAVAASACVPGIFDPLSFPELYPDRIVRLVDGGVQDNQGTSALLEQGCNVLLVSDASGQMGEEDEPANDFIGVPLRSNSILQARVRLAQFDEIESRRRSSLLKGVMFLHLKKDLDSHSVDWTNCEDPTGESTNSRAELTSYGVRKEIQRLLASIRTDLDSFNDTEASALMVSGYLMTEHEFPKSFPGFAEPKPIEPPWRFLKLKELMQRRGGNEDRYNELKSLLKVAKLGPFKIWKLIPILNVLGVVLIAAAVAGISYLLYSWRNESIITYGALGLFLLSMFGGFVAAKLLGPQVAKLLSKIGTPKRIEATAWRIVILGAAAVGLFFLAWIHIIIFDWLYLRRGRLERVTGEAVAPMKPTQ
jgi:predicted acylesterase/phospholipase RssA